MVGAREELRDLVEKIDDAFQSKVRLGIVASLAGAGSLDFKGLKLKLGLSDGNLSSHLTFLERRGFVRSERSFVSKKSHTEIFLTDEGLLAFQQYLDAIEAIVSSSRVGYA